MMDLLFKMMDFSFEMMQLVSTMMDCVRNSTVLPVWWGVLVCVIMLYYVM